LLDEVERQEAVFQALDTVSRRTAICRSGRARPSEAPALRASPGSHWLQPFRDLVHDLRDLGIGFARGPDHQRIDQLFDGRGSYA